MTGQRVRELRQRHGLTQRQLAARAGVPQPAISMYERGRKAATVDVLDRLGRACGEQLRFVPIRQIPTEFVEVLRLAEHLPHSPRRAPLQDLGPLWRRIRDGA